jgi:lipoprotein signal peptidase
VQTIDKLARECNEKGLSVQSVSFAGNSNTGAALSRVKGSVQVASAVRVATVICLLAL